jgi:hypothetical protein
MKRYNKQDIEKVIKWLRSIEPKCNFCEQCVFGYKFDKISKQLCENQQFEIQKQHKHWEQKMQKWKDRLKYAK